MGKTRRNSNTNSGRTSHDAATSTNLMNNQMARNPMHTREQGQIQPDGHYRRDDGQHGRVRREDGRQGWICLWRRC